MKILPKQTRKTTSWSGGKTTELYIYPNDADYHQRNFLFRVSTATIEIEESEFTKLEGVNRKIMILDGKIELIHKNHYNKTLNKFDTDSFSGEWETLSKGKATDFNLMTKANIGGHISYLELDAEKTKIVNFAANTQKILFYIYSGTIQLQDKTINSGDVVFFETLHNHELFNINAKVKSEVVFVELTGF